MSEYFGAAEPTREVPEHGSPTFVVGPNSLGHLSLHPTDASFVEDQLKRRIRRITWLDRPEADHIFEMWRASRMLYELSFSKGQEDIRHVSNLSEEDVDVLLGFHGHWSVEKLKKVLQEMRPKVRKAGPVDPVEADRMAKEIVDLMAC